MVLTNTEIDAAVPAAGTPNRALTNAALKELAAEFSETVTLTGGTTQLVEDTHRNALLKLTSGSNTITAPASDTGRWQVVVWNDTGSDQTVAGQTVSDGSVTTILVDGLTATPFSTSEVKVVSIFISAGDDTVLWQNTPFHEYAAYTVLDVENETISGSITLDFELENDTDDGNFTSITGIDAVTVTTTKATDAASAANVSDDGQRQLRITGSSNSSAIGIILTMRVRV